MKISEKNFFKTSDGAHIYFEDTGEGMPLVMIPGFLCTTRFFVRNVPELSKYCRVITIDPRGQGRSSKTLAGNTVERHATDVKELLEHLDLQQVVLLGWSLGSSVAVSYATGYAENRLAGLILVDGSLFPFSDESWNKHRARDFNVDNWMNTYMPLFYDPKTFEDKFVERVSNGMMSDEDRAWVVEEWKRTMPWTALELHYDFCHTDNVQNLPKLTVPVSFFGGSSKSYGLEMIAEYASRIQGYSEINEFYEGGHMMFYYEHEKFNRLILKFLDKLKDNK